MAKKQKTYTADEMKLLKARLIERRGYLASAAADKLTEFLRTLDSELVREVRDMTHGLAMINTVLEYIDTLIRFAESTGEPQTVPHLDDCGLED